MAISFVYLASNHPLDVTAGAAGFVAGSVLIAGSLISLSLQRRLPPAPAPLAPAAPVAVQEPPLDVARWVAHFATNRENRPEPDWTAPIVLPAAVLAPLVRSLEQFQLGDGGGPAYLIARNRERFLGQAEGTRRLVDLWFAEEREHARLLGAAVARFGGTCITKHWSFTAFLAARKWFGVRFELTVLLLTEIVSTVYYRMLLRHANDSALRAMCRLILRDEIGHVSFHRDRLARQARARTTGFGHMWMIRFRVLGLTAATVLWVNHAPGLKAVGVTRGAFYRAVRRELSVFIARLHREIVSTHRRDFSTDPVRPSGTRTCSGVSPGAVEVAGRSRF
jgi:hypothetical protein